MRCDSLVTDDNSGGRITDILTDLEIHTARFEVIVCSMVCSCCAEEACSRASRHVPSGQTERILLMRSPARHEKPTRDRSAEVYQSYGRRDRRKRRDYVRASRLSAGGRRIGRVRCQRLSLSWPRMGNAEPRILAIEERNASASD